MIAFKSHSGDTKAQDPESPMIIRFIEFVVYR